MCRFTKYLVVGCGLSGAVIARELAEKNHNVIIWDKRPHIGGNLYDYVDDYGILVQKYGPHVFHTSNEKLFNYINKYGDWEKYFLKSGATWDDVITPSPFNFKTIDLCFGKSKAEQIKNKLLQMYKNKNNATILELLNSKDRDIEDLALYLYEKDFAPYTSKQWGTSIEKLSPEIFKRVPIYFSYHEGYFDDTYQVVPKHSYTTFFHNLLNHPNISIELKKDACDYFVMNEYNIEIPQLSDVKYVIYTGPIDRLFSYKYGKLPYRSLSFEWKHYQNENISEYAVTAYPQHEKITRITDYSKLPIQHGKGSTCALEYPCSYNEENEPYYPVNTDKSLSLYNKYKEKADQISNLFYCGRLADFKYYNMDQALERALSLSKTILKLTTAKYSVPKLFSDHRL